MNLQTSCFNSAIFRGNMKRLWWVSVLHFLGIFLLGLLPFYIDYHDRSGLFFATENYANSRLCSASILPYLILGVLTVGLSALLFSYLNSKSATATMHAVPVKRKTLYITNVVFGIVSLALPILAGGAVLLFMRTNPNLYQLVSLNHILLFMGTQFAYAMIGFSFAVFIGMLTASSVAHLILTYIFAILPLYFEATLKQLLNLNLYGFAVQTVEQFTSQYVYFGIDKLSTVSGFLTYLAYSVVLLVGGYFIYKARHLENTAEIVAFPRLKPIFIYGVAVCFGVAGYFYLAELMELSNLYLILPFGILGLVIANMLTKKAFTLKGALIPAVALVATVTAVFCLFHFDLTGFERRVPARAKIEGVSVTTQSPASVNYGGVIDGRRMVPVNAYFPVMTKEADIENVLKFHRQKTMERTDDGDRVLYVQYKLAGGKTMTRKYFADYEYDKSLLAPILEAEENRKARFPILRDEGEYVVSASVSDRRLPNGFNTYYAEKTEDKEVLARLLSALSADVAVVPYEEFVYEGATLTQIHLNYDIPMVWEGTDILVPQQVYEGGYSDSHTYAIRPSYKNTIAVLKELGFYDVLPTADAFSAVEVVRFDNERGREIAATIEEKSEIAAIYDYVVNSQSVMFYDQLAYASGKEILYDEEDGSIRLKFVSATNAFSVTRDFSQDMPHVLKKFYE